MIQPVIKDITVHDTSSEGFSEEPECRWFTIEIGERDHAGADNFEIGLCNRGWAGSVKTSSVARIPGAAHVSGPIFLASKPTKEEAMWTVQALIDALGPYDSWPDFGVAMSPFLQWEWFDTEMAKRTPRPIQ